MIKFIEKGVCAPKGFEAAGIHAGFRKNKKRKDLALIVSDKICNAAAVYTRNKVKSAPIKVNHGHLKNNEAIAIITNSGNANTYAENGVFIARRTCEILAREIGAKATDIVICSTGVIGQELFFEPFSKGVPLLVKHLSYNGSIDAANAIMTTDTVPKQTAVQFKLGAKSCHIGGIAKGSGMINPNMATMLSFITTDVAISKKMLKLALKEIVDETYNQVSIDGDTSTNDTVCILANGLASNNEITEDCEDYRVFKKALWKVAHYLSKEIAKDGEGATKQIVCKVMGARTKQIAKKVSKMVIQSELVKTAIFGEDANWGRILCAIGYTPGNFAIKNIDIYLSSKNGKILVCKKSIAVQFDEIKAKRILEAEEIDILIYMNAGDEEAYAYGCDLTYNYVKINASYRT